MQRVLSLRSLASASLGLIGAVLLHGAGHAADLSVCIDSASAAAPRDQALAEKVAQREGATLQVHHFDGAGDDEGFTAKEFRALLDKDCDLVLGYPIDTTDGGPPPGLMITHLMTRPASAWSPPYRCHPRDCPSCHPERKSA